MPDTDFVIIIIPAVNSRGRRLQGAFDGYLGGKWLCRSSAPLLEAARALLRRGYDPTLTIGMAHASKPSSPRARQSGVRPRMWSSTTASRRPRQG